MIPLSSVNRLVPGRAFVRGASIAEPTPRFGVMGAEEVDGGCPTEGVVEVGYRCDGLFRAINGCHLQWEVNQADACWY